MIRVDGLSKTYRVPVRRAGVRAAFGSIFRRQYRDVVAVDQIGFAVERGETVGFLGPNGAGKTTTLKMLAGLLHPTGGVVEVGGFVPFERRREFLKSIMLVVGQKNQLYWDLPAADSLEFHRIVYDVSRADYDAQLEELTEHLDLAELLTKPVRQLSLGERMRCELALSLIHRPRVLFLDEPTIGLDVTLKSRVRSFLKEYAARHGATLLLTSHDMDDVAALCPRVLVIDHGALSFDGSIEGLYERMRPEKRLLLQFDVPIARATLEAIGTVESVSELGATLRVGRNDVRGAVAEALSTLPLRDITVENPPLDDILSDLFRETSEGRQKGASRT